MHNYVAVAILFLINLINYMDRFTIASVLIKVRASFSLNDGEAGLLQTSFIVSYMLMAPIFGYLGDRYSRKYIMSLGILFWSATTFIGSLIPSSNPGLFFLMRALVGTGEASYSTIAPTIIADLFERTMRTRMLALFYFAIPVGSGLGYVIGSEVAVRMHSWRWALRVTPILGVLSVVCLAFFLREPQRGFSDGAAEIQEKSELREDIKYLFTVPTYIWSTAGFTCVCFAIGALSWWAPTYMDSALKVEGDPKPLDWINFIFGIITCVAGIIGVLAGSGGAQFYRKYNPRADPLVCGFAVLAGVPFVFLGIVIAHVSSNTSWIFIFIGVTFLCMNWALVADILLYVIVPNKRSMAQAIQILISHLLGDATSPFIVGYLQDWFCSGRTGDSISYWSLQYALYVSFFILVIGGFAFLRASSFVVADQELCKSQIQRERVGSSSSETSIHTLPPDDLAFNPFNSDNVIRSFPPSNPFIDADMYNLIPEQM